MKTSTFLALVLLLGALGCNKQETTDASTTPSTTAGGTTPPGNKPPLPMSGKSQASSSFGLNNAPK